MTKRPPGSASSDEGCKLKRNECHKFFNRPDANGLGTILRRTAFLFPGKGFGVFTVHLHVSDDPDARVPSECHQRSVYF